MLIAKIWLINADITILILRSDEIINNTFVDCGDRGVRSVGGVNLLKNNIVDQALVSAYLGAYDGSSNYNLSNLGAATGGANDVTSATVSYVNQYQCSNVYKSQGWGGGSFENG